MTDISNEKQQQTLSAPLSSWRLYLLLLFSFTLYLVPLIYRMAKDIRMIGQYRFYPLRYTIAALLPLIDFVIYYKLAKNIADAAQQKGIVFKFSAAALTAAVLLGGIVMQYLPQFFYPVSGTLQIIPFLILHQQMNALRCAHDDAWLQSESRFSWQQRALMLLGIPLIALSMYGSKAEFWHFTAKQLSIGQVVSGNAAGYQLKIPEGKWRQVPAGTLHPGSDLELMGAETDDWVIVLLWPNQQQNLDDYVDWRRKLVTQGWKNYQVEERRSLDSGLNLKPVSHAHYSGYENFMRPAASVYVTTIITPEQGIQVVGQGSRKTEKFVQELVESLRMSDPIGK
jgi:hypothetical protein